MSSAILGEQYQSLEQQRETAELGMWIFLGTELMLFGGLFTGYTVYRTAYAAGFAQGSHLLDLAYAAPNTAVLILSSLTMALAVDSARFGRQRRLFWYLVITAALGVLFMGVKAAEYAKHFQDGMVPGLAWTYAGPYPQAVQLFFVTYFLMTGVHALHLIIGIVVIGVTAVFARRSPSAPVEMVGLYWHFIDVIWTLLFPLLYLMGLRQ